ncbi:MAG: hypothetical protein ABI366_05665 [Ginsengibacter sp.]
MRKLSLFILALSLFFSNCVQPSQDRNEKLIDHASEMPDTFHLLTQYWELTDADNPTSKDISFTSDDGAENISGIVFMTDSTVLENPVGEKTYGKFSLNGNTIDVKYDDGRMATYVIDRINKEQLLLSRTEKKHTSKLTYKATNTSWPESNKNAFSKQNYQWSQKPKKPETDEEIKNRVKESIQFYVYYFEGFVKGNTEQIDFNAMPNCLNWYQGGISIENEDKLNQKWIDCFYSKEQALKGRQMLEDAIVKKYNWDEKETNWMKQLIPVLQQIHDQM